MSARSSAGRARTDRRERRATPSDARLVAADDRGVEHGVDEGQDRGPVQPAVLDVDAGPAVGEDDERHRLVEPAVAAVAVQQLVAGVAACRAGAKSSRHTQNSAVSMTSSEAALTGSAASSAARLAAHSARALVVRCPTAVSARRRLGAGRQHRGADRRRDRPLGTGARAGPSTSSRNTLPRWNTTMCRSRDGPGQSGEYGTRTVSCTGPGIRVSENRNLFCSIVSACPRWTIGGISSRSSRACSPTWTRSGTAARSSWDCPVSANRKKKFAFSAIRSRRPRYRYGQNVSSQLYTPGDWS